MTQALIAQRIQEIRSRMARLDGTLIIHDGQLYIPTLDVFYSGEVCGEPDEWDDHVLNAQRDIEFLLELLGGK